MTFQTEGRLCNYFTSADHNISHEREKKSSRYYICLLHRGIFTWYHKHNNLGQSILVMFLTWSQGTQKNGSNEHHLRDLRTKSDGSVAMRNTMEERPYCIFWFSPNQHCLHETFLSGGEAVLGWCSCVHLGLLLWLLSFLLHCCSADTRCVSVSMRGR